MIDEECGLEISQYLIFDEASFVNLDEYALTFMIKNDCETEIKCLIEKKFHKEEKYDNIYVRYPSAAKIIEVGKVKHIYFFLDKAKNGLLVGNVSYRCRY